MKNTMKRIWSSILTFIEWSLMGFGAGSIIHEIDSHCDASGYVMIAFVSIGVAIISMNWWKAKIQKWVLGWAKEGLLENKDN